MPCALLLGHQIVTCADDLFNFRFQFVVKFSHWVTIMTLCKCVQNSNALMGNSFYDYKDYQYNVLMDPIVTEDKWRKGSQVFLNSETQMCF